MQRGQPFLAAGRLRDAEPGTVEKLPHQGENVFFVVYDKHTATSHEPTSSSGGQAVT